MKVTLPLTISFALLTTFASAVPNANPGSDVAAPADHIARVVQARAGAGAGAGAIEHIRRQDDSSTSTGDAGDSGDASTDDGSTSGDGTTDDGSGSGSGDPAADTTASATYDGSGGQEEDGGPSLTLTDASTATDGAPFMYTLTSDSASDVAATSADPNATPSAAPSSSSSHSGLTDYNTTTRTATGNVQGTSAAQTTGAPASASSSAPASGAKPALTAVSPLSILTVVVAGAMGVAKVLY
ncbi:hypothetical protein IAU59_005959 [Kwoniella sp. CBS 9459]